MATNKPPKRAQKVLQKWVRLLLRGHIGKGVVKEFLAPTPSIRQPLFETSEQNDVIDESIVRLDINFGVKGQDIRGATSGRVSPPLSSVQCNGDGHPAMPEVTSSRCHSWYIASRVLQGAAPTWPI